ncbi:MAG: PqqD family protein [Clostridia bacterium]|nr:PqqD family protein [Clostridia bacterium]
MELKREFVLRNIADDWILVPVGKDAIDMNGLIVLNELGVFLWQKIPEAANEDDLLSAVLEEYDVTPDEARADIADFLKKLREMQIF